MPLLVADDLAKPSTGFWSSEGSSCIGEGKGGGMSVPSVKEPNFRSRAGSWNLVPLLLERDGMLEDGERSLLRGTVRKIKRIGVGVLLEIGLV